MIKVELPPDALTRVRLAYSPMWELSLSLRQLLHDPDSSRHAPWLRSAITRIDPEPLRLLRGLMPNPYWFPDFLSPSPGTRPRLLNTELRQVSAMTADDIRRELSATWDGPVDKALVRVLDGPEPGVVLRDALSHYWERAVAPVWPRIKRVLAAELSHRADALAADGLHQTLNSLHEQVTFDGRILCLDLERYDAERRGDADGLALLPCVFAWPKVLVVAAEPHPITVAYPPRGAATIWDSRSNVPPAASSALIGRTRTRILIALERPMNAVELAETTGLSAPAISQQLAILRRAGLVDSRKSGRTVWSVRTSLASELLVACRP